MDIKQLKQILDDHNIRIGSDVQRQLDTALQNCNITTDVVMVIINNHVVYMTEAPHFQGSYALQHIVDLLMEYGSKVEDYGNKVELAYIDNNGVLSRCISHKTAVDLLLQEYYGFMARQSVKSVVEAVQYIKHRRTETCL